MTLTFETKMTVLLSGYINFASSALATENNKITRELIIMKPVDNFILLTMRTYKSTTYNSHV